MSEKSAHYFAKITERQSHNLEDVQAHNRLLNAATATLIERIERAEAQLKDERAQSDMFQQQVRMLVQRELELLRMLAAKTAQPHG